MRLAALYSGGKDSTYAIYRARQAGHQVSCLLTIHPASADSPLLHHPGTAYTHLQSRSMGIPLLDAKADSVADTDENAALSNLVEQAIQQYQITGLVHGGLRSVYQRRRFEKICQMYDLEPVSPLWQPKDTYLQSVICDRFQFVVISVSAGGLDQTWLGRVVDLNGARCLDQLARMHGLAPDFEGGEAETFVVDCPLFACPIMLCGCPHWNGYTGRFEIVEAAIVDRC